jgi:hypothetical protein
MQRTVHQRAIYITLDIRCTESLSLPGMPDNEILITCP